MTKYQIVRADLERARERLDSADKFDLHVQVMLEAVIETVLTLECAKRPCEIIPFPGASQSRSLDG
jgi:hypothetical protein